MLAELGKLNKKIPKKYRIPYNVDAISQGVIVSVSSKFKKICVIPSNRKENREFLKEFSGNRSSNQAPLLGIDTLEYVFGITFRKDKDDAIPANGKKKRKSAKHVASEKHIKYMDKLRIHSKAVPYLEALLKFLDYYDKSKKCQKLIFDEMKNISNTASSDKGVGFISFHFEDIFPDHPLHKDQEYLDYLSRKPSEKYKVTCGLCGKNDYPVWSIKTPKVFTTDGVLASFNFDQYPSLVRYGNAATRGSEQAGVCLKCYFDAYSALHYLLRNKITIPVEVRKKTPNGWATEIVKRDIYSNRKDFSHNDSVLFWFDEDGDSSEITKLEHSHKVDLSNKEDLRNLCMKGDPDFGSELDSPKRKRGKRHNPNGDSGYFYLISIRRNERGALQIFSPQIESVATVRKNLTRWEYDVYSKRFSCVLGVSNLARGIQKEKGYNKRDSASSDDVPFSRVRRMLYDIAISNKSLDYSYITSIIHNYLYNNVTIEVVRALLNLIRRNPNGVTERYRKIGRVLSLFGSVRAIGKATGYENFEKLYMPSVLRSPKMILPKLFEANTYHIRDEKLTKSRSWYDAEIKKLLQEIDVDSLPTSMNASQQASILSGYVDREVEWREFAGSKTNKEVVA